MPKHPWPNTRLATRPLLELAVTFSVRPERPEKMAAGVVRILRDLFGDRPVAVSTKGRSITDGTIALSDLIGAQRDLVRQGSRTGLSLSAGTGRGELSRQFIDFYHGYHYTDIPGTRTRLAIELVDIHEQRFPSLQRAIDTFFELAVASGNCVGGFGRLSEIPRQWAPSWRPFDFMVPACQVEREIARRDPGLSISTIPALDWITLLAPHHLRVLGGRERFLADAPLHIWCPSTRRSLVRPIASSHVVVELGPVLDDISTGDFTPATSESLSANIRAAHYFHRRLIDAGLMTWQQAPLAKPTSRRDQLRERADLLRILREADAPCEPDSDDNSAPPDAAAREQLWKHLSANAPECFRHDPQSASAPERRWATREYGDFATTFIVADAKGNTNLPLWGRFREDSSDLTDPILVGAPTLRDCSFAFQSHRHGYNGKQGWNHWPRRKAPDPFHCPRCTHDRFRVLTVFQYSGDEVDQSDRRTLTQPENFFGWIAIRAQCGGCGWKARVFDCECS